MKVGTFAPGLFHSTLAIQISTVPILNYKVMGRSLQVDRWDLAAQSPLRISALMRPLHLTESDGLSVTIDHIAKAVETLAPSCLDEALPGEASDPVR
jgi:hypothetical protein